MKIRKKVKGLMCTAIVFIMVTSLVFVNSTSVSAATSVSITVNTSNYLQLTRAKSAGVNVEMSLISDDMWNKNGKWMEETFDASGAKIMRWGYDAWAFDWQNEVPLSPNKYWGALNTKDAAGTFGLYEFIDFCKNHNVIPFVDIPIESLDTAKGTATLQQVKDLTAAMANYINSQGITLAYFDMGNEPWNTHTSIGAAYYGDLFSQFQPLIKNANPNYKLVLQRAPQTILWNSWNSTAASHAAGYFDAYDDHRYAFYDWNKYYNKNDDSFWSVGNSIAGAEPLMGECNIGWTPTNDDWQAGHVRDLGGSLALLNALLDMVNQNSYNQIITWPSHYPSKLSVSGCPDNSFGWFDLDQWYLYNKTQRFTGPMLAHMIVNQNILDRKVTATSSSAKVRTFAYTDSANSVLKVIAINKLNDTVSASISLPSAYGRVNASILKGVSLTDRNPVYVNHLPGNSQVSGTTFTNSIPPQCAVVYTFYNDNSTGAPGSFSLSSPGSGNTNVSTAKTFRWTAASGAYNYHLTVSKNSNFTSPVIDVDVGNFTKYQTMLDLESNTQYYWKVTAVNKNGTANATNNGISFTTANVQVQSNIAFNKLASADSQESANPAANGNDANNSTRWCAADSNAGHWWKVDLGQSYNILGTEVTWEKANAYKYKIEVSGDNSSWTVAADKTGNTSSVQVIKDSFSANARYVRITVTGGLSSSTYASFYDMKVFGDPSMQVFNIWNDDSLNISHGSNWNDQTFTGCHNNDDHSSKTAGSYMEFTFTGTQAKISGVKGNWCGKADILVDGVAAATIDTYNASTQYQALFYDTGTLAYGSHNIRLNVRGDKNSSSTDSWIEFDKVELK